MLSLKMMKRGGLRLCTTGSNKTQVAQIILNKQQVQRVAV